MDENNFIEKYIKPSESGLDKSFTMALPEIPGLKEVSSFIVQGRMEDTVSTNIITEYESGSEDIRLVEVYKRTENEKSGVFVRLVGTISLVKKGYPVLFLDAAVTNVDPRTSERVDLSTMIAVHMPQANPEKRDILFDLLTEKTKENGIESGTIDLPSLPDFWGQLWNTRSKGVNLDMIKQIRDSAWESYKDFCEQSDAVDNFDYKPMQDHMIYKNSEVEHNMFKKMGLQVTSKVQAAFFSVMSTGI
ncbi:hypothetical protein ACFL20_08735 [Spirochaetota bacterium]